LQVKGVSIICKYPEIIRQLWNRRKATANDLTDQEFWLASINLGWKFWDEINRKFGKDTVRFASVKTEGD